MSAKLHLHRLTRLIVVGLSIGALAAPAASAMPASPDPIAADPERAPVVQSVNDGFDWGSAAVGVGGAGALALLIAAGGFTYRTRHQHDQMHVAR